MKSNFLKNKKAAGDGSEIMFLYFWIMIIIVVVMVSLTMNSAANARFDVRPLEEKYLALRISDCLSPVPSFQFQKNLIDDYTEEGLDDFLKICRINFDPKDKEGNYEYFAEISYYDYETFDEKSIPLKSILIGNKNLGSYKKSDGSLKSYIFYVANESSEFVLEIKPAVGKEDDN